MGGSVVGSSSEVGLWALGPPWPPHGPRGAHGQRKPSRGALASKNHPEAQIRSRELFFHDFLNFGASDDFGGKGAMAPVLSNCVGNTQIICNLYSLCKSGGQVVGHTVFTHYFYIMFEIVVVWGFKASIQIFKVYTNTLESVH